MYQASGVAHIALTLSVQMHGKQSHTSQEETALATSGKDGFVGLAAGSRKSLLTRVSCRGWLRLTMNSMCAGADCGAGMMASAPPLADALADAGG